MINALKKSLSEQSDLVLVLSVIGILGILFVPIPSGLLDVLLIINFSFALLILLLTFYVEKPLEFSTFPSLLLIITLFRLSLNIAATRLILSDADAGQVIGAIGTHVVSGNYVIGFIVFLVLIVVQYVVVTSGAQRVAEVAARFTLDSMPGKQMSIDADMNMGIIDEKEAQTRRKDIEREANFYGAMDGASKFVKGDAIAGIIIIIIDILGGLTIGIAQKGMEWGDALHTFALLTIGDGIVTQIPALIISTGTGIIVTRAASDAFLSKEISSQIISYPKALIIISLGLMFILFLPGMPKLPVIFVLLIFGAIAIYAYGKKSTLKEETEDSTDDSPDENIYDLLTVDPIVIKIGRNLISMVDGDDSKFMEKIVSFRKEMAQSKGFIIPKVRVKDEKSLGINEYKIYINNVNIGGDEIFVEKYLAINPGKVTSELNGQSTKDPTYKLNATWIDEADCSLAKQSGYTVVDPNTVIITHVTETIKSNIAELISRNETDQLVNKVREREPGLVDELLPNILSLSDVQKILQNLIKENVSILNLSAILEVLVDEGKKQKDISYLTECVRQRLSSHICQSLSLNGEMHVLTLAPEIEHKLATSMLGNTSAIMLEPKYAEKILLNISSFVEKMSRSNINPVIITAPELRKHLFDLTERVVPQLSVLSIKEISNIVAIKSFGVVNV